MDSARGEGSTDPLIVQWKSRFRRIFTEIFGDYLEICREMWTARYDYVLIDSRTGVSDIGGICTAHLPDRLVVLFTANMQSLRGVVDIAERAGAARDLMPYDRGRLTVMPLLSRFDTREEYGRSEEWRRIALRQTEGMFRDWLNQSIPAEAIARHLTLPYVSYWSFGESLAVHAEANPSADQIGFALETVAAVVAHDFDRTELLVENRDAYVAAARTSNRQFSHDLRVSTPRSTLDLANALIAELRALDVRVELSLSGDRSLLTNLEDDARHLCLVVDGNVSRWQTAEVELFLHRVKDVSKFPLGAWNDAADSRPTCSFVRRGRMLRHGHGETRNIPMIRSCSIICSFVYFTGLWIEATCKIALS